MNTARLRLPTHKPLKVLPWYVNCTLERQEALKVAVHVRSCPICQREVNDLARMFATRARATPKRPVDEARLDDVFARIDRYEAERGQARRAESRSVRAPRAGFLDWLIARPVLASACAALVLAVIAIPMLMPRASDEGAYQVLADPNSVAEPLRVRLRFQAAMEPAAAERVVRTSLAQQKLTNPFKIERRPNGDYLVIFEQKPSVDAMSRLLDTLRRAENVADVAIDDG